jgi:hypothetical protein
MYTYTDTHIYTAASKRYRQQERWAETVMYNDKAMRALNPKP